MTITITLPRIRVPTVTERDLRRVLSLAEPAIMAVADACGAGLPVRIALGIGLKIAQQASRS
ncbi:GNAT family acetyltransferase [Streptomyces shenzhenensis]|uniref:GNAT family acetyltransferase n=1 Tax=Streptomyces shenzhenensis TaxID=943815 RepID=A0A3M0I2R2_9ACTN|nr:GNAT family acetyltransferase [Streptomyces shenzhenensis]RMB80369.1 GNAT family acetyltransferase [Streptomyces shenzhenensis]